MERENTIKVKIEKLFFINIIMNNTGERFIPGLGGLIEMEHLNRYYFVINQLNLKNNTVLDIASGEGYGSKILSLHAKNVIGVDISSEAVEHANCKYKSNNLSFIQGSATEIPLEDMSVDVVVSFETIEHHDKHVEMINEIKRVLKKDGILIISSPDKYHYSEVRNYKNTFHVKELYYEEFRTLMTENFIHVSFYLQRTFSGSIIAQDGTNNSYNTPLIVDETGEKQYMKPKYNIAIASNQLDTPYLHQIIMYQESDVAITRLDIVNAEKNAEWETSKKLHKTKTWRVGKVVLAPFRYLRRLFKL